MNCKECKSNNIEYDEKLGEKVCVKCGFVVVDRMFEERVTNFNDDGTLKPITKMVGLGSVGVPSKLRRLDTRTSDNTHKKNLQYLLAISAEYQTSQTVRDELCNNYLTLARGHQFRGYNVDERVAAVIFFTLKENNYAIKIKTLAEKCDAKPSRASKLARKIALFFKRPWVLSQIDYAGEFERISQQMGKDRSFIWDCNKVHMYLMPICEENNIVKNDSYIGAVIYITAILRDEKINQKVVREATKSYHSISRYRIIKKLLNIDFRKWTVDEFTSGIYTEEKI